MSFGALGQMQILINMFVLKKLSANSNNCNKVVLVTLIQTCCNKIVTKLTSKAVAMLLYHDCINLVGTTF